MRFATVCSGIEAASQAWVPLGWKPQFFSEIEPFPCAYLAHHYPDVPNYGDMTKWKDWPDATLDVLAGGTPCQDYSVAGKRAGMAGERGGLTLTFLEIVDRYRPRWVVWENVPGVLSSNGGRDFAAFLGDLGQRGYGFAYRVLDAQFTRTRRFPFAVPQRRRRVWVVGYIGDWRPAAAVLFDAESLQGNPAPRRETGQGIAPTISARPTGGGGLGTDFDLDGGLIANSGDTGYCLTASAQQSLDAETETLIAVAHSLRAEGHDASEDGTGRQNLVPVMVADTLVSNGDAHSGFRDEKGLVPIAIQERAVSETLDVGPQGKGWQEDHAYTLEARNKVQAVAFDLAQITSKANRTRVGPDLPASTLNAAGQMHVAVQWAVRRLSARECERLQGFRDNSTMIPRKTARKLAADELRYLRALTHEQMAEIYGVDPDGFVPPTDEELRRLAADGPRYKALGNSWAVNCAEWIGERIELVEGIIASQQVRAAE